MNETKPDTYYADWLRYHLEPMPEPQPPNYLTWHVSLAAVCQALETACRRSHRVVLPPEVIVRGIQKYFPAASISIVDGRKAVTNVRFYKSGIAGGHLVYG